MTGGGISRRHVLGWGLGTLAVLGGGGAGAVELVDQGVLPGKGRLEQLTASCNVWFSLPRGRTPGPSWSGTFASRARRRTVGYTLAYPPGHRKGDALPLVLALHGFGGDHAHALAGMSPAQALAQDGVPPMAIVTVDGGGGYWHRHPQDDPMGMILDELIPMCRQLGLGRAPGGIGVTGVSMGGYGSLLLAETRPDVFRAVAAISPAVWLTYKDSRNANPGAYVDAADFAAHDVITYAARLRRNAVRVAIGKGDPFRPGFEALRRVLPAGAETHLDKGCHTGDFMANHEVPSLKYLAARLTPAGS